MAMIRIRKAAVYISKNPADDKPVANLFNAILEIDKQTNKNKMVGFNENNVQIPLIHLGKNLERLDVSDLNEGRKFVLENAVLHNNTSENTVTITAQAAREV